MASMRTKTSLIETFQTYSTSFKFDPEDEITISLREVEEFVKHIHASLQAQYNFTPKAATATEIREAKQDEREPNWIEIDSSHGHFSFEIPDPSQGGTSS